MAFKEISDCRVGKLLFVTAMGSEDLSPQNFVSLFLPSVVMILGVFDIKKKHHSANWAPRSGYLYTYASFIYNQFKHNLREADIAPLSFWDNDPKTYKIFRFFFDELISFLFISTWKANTKCWLRNHTGCIWSFVRRFNWPRDDPGSQPIKSTLNWIHL